MPRRTCRCSSAGGSRRGHTAIRSAGGSLQVVTRNLRAGYLRKNGVPYSENAVMTEHWDLYKRPNGEEWLTITTQLDDPQYLRNARLTAPIFKKEPNGSKWDPTPCSRAMVSTQGQRQKAKARQRSKVRTQARYAARHHRWCARLPRLRPVDLTGTWQRVGQNDNGKRAGTGRSPGHAGQR
jgi:hypothetical protein